MKLTRNWKRAGGGTAAVLAIALLTPQSSKAIFGFGDIVFDPTNYAEMISQTITLASQLEQMKAQFTIWQYNFQSLTGRAFWKTFAIQFSNTAMQNRYGETNGMNQGDPNSWANATLPVGSNDYLGTEVLGSSYQLSNLASVEMTDGSSVDAINALGEYRTNADPQDRTISDLEGRAFSDDPNDNTEAAQLNIANAASVANLRAGQTTAAMSAAILQQMTVANSFQRNTSANALNTFGDLYNSQQTNPSALTGADDTITNFEFQ